MMSYTLWFHFFPDLGGNASVSLLAMALVLCLLHNSDGDDQLTGTTNRCNCLSADISCAKDGRLF